MSRQKRAPEPRKIAQKRALADYYNKRVPRDPSNPPTRRELSEHVGVGIATIQRWLDELWEAGLLCSRPRKRPS